MTRKANAIWLELDPKGRPGVHSCGVYVTIEPVRPDRCQPVDVQNWEDVTAGDQVVWPDGRVDDVIGVTLRSSFPAMKGEPEIVSAREWERTGLDVNGRPTEAAAMNTAPNPTFGNLPQPGQ